MNNLLNQTLSKIVTDHHQAAAVFEKYGLDFCCKGKRPLISALEEKNIPAQAVANELTSVIATENKLSDFNEMSLTELAEYIVRVHHGYTKANMPQILAYLQRVAAKHGEHFPYMVQVHKLFSELTEEMDEHMFKEEKILFPRIKKLELLDSMQMPLEYLQIPIDVMEHEHDAAGNIMQRIRELTNNYTPPASACTTFKLSLSSLQAFEADLHQHVHLENNILFPKAIAYLQQLKERVNF